MASSFYPSQVVLALWGRAILEEKKIIIKKISAKRISRLNLPVCISLVSAIFFVQHCVSNKKQLSNTLQKSLLV